MLDEIIKGKSKNAHLDALVFPNRRDFRIWFIQLLDAKNEQLRNVQVIQQDGNGVIISKIYGQNATYDGSRKVWVFYNGKIAYIDPEGNVSSEEFFTRKEVSGWSETPWRLSSATLKGKYMTVPQLEHYLKENGDFPESNLAEFKTQMWYRFALPWNVLVVVFVASPLCIAFSRRGALGGIAGGLFLFIGLFSSSNVFLALGQGSRISAADRRLEPGGNFSFAWIHPALPPGDQPADSIYRIGGRGRVAGARVAKRSASPGGASGGSPILCCWNSGVCWTVVRFFIQHVVRYALRHKVLAVINILSVALGVSVYLAVQIANRSATAAFRAGIDVVAGRANIEVRGTIDDGLLPKLRAIPGVTAATPLVERLVTLPAWPGEYLHVLGVDPFTNSTFENFKVSKSGRESFDADAWFGDPRALAVAQKFAQSHKLKRGDSIRVKFGERTIDLVLSSVLEAKDGDSRFAAMDIGWAQELFGLQGKLTGVLFQISDPNNPKPVSDRIRHLVPPDAVVEEPGARSGQVEHLLSGFELNLTALSMISLLVGVFLIYNTVTASVVRRRSEVGILRALGVSRAKVRWLFLGEAALYGMFGSVAGCVGGVLLSNFLVRAVSKTVTNLYVLTSIDHFYLPLWQIPLVLFAGMGSVLVGAFVPANAGANLPPLRALNMGVLIERSEKPRALWILLSGGCLVAAFVTSKLALMGYRSAGFVAAFFTLIGFCCLSPYVAHGLGSLSSRMFRFLFLPRLAARNLVRSLYRHAITIAALASALAMLVSVSIMIYSFRKTIDRWLEHRLVADLFIGPAANEIVGFENFVTDDFTQFLRSRPEVEMMDTFRYLTATVNGEPTFLGVVTGTNRNIPDFVGGGDSAKYKAFQLADRVTISEPLSRRLKVNQGNIVTIATPLGPRSFQVVGVFYDYSRDSGVMLMQRANFEKYLA